MKTHREVIAWIALQFPQATLRKENILAIESSVRDIPLDLFEAAARAAVDESEYFPSVALLKRMAVELHDEKMDIPSADEAWEWVVPRLAGPGESTEASGNMDLAREAVRLMGGWEHLGLGQVADRQWRRKEFVQIYNSLMHREHRTLLASAEERRYLEIEDHELPKLASGKAGELVKQIASGMEA